MYMYIHILYIYICICICILYIIMIIDNSHIFIQYGYIIFQALISRGDQGHFGTPDKSHFGTHREAPVKRHFGTHRRQFGTPTDLWNTRGLGRELRGGWDDNVHLPCTTQVNHQHCYAFLHIPPIRPHTQRRHPHRLLSHAFPPAS